MTIIEKDEENIKEIEDLYMFDIVLFESTVLIMDNIECCICKVPFANVYDISMQDVNHTEIISYKSVDKLDSVQEKYFNLLKGDLVTDKQGNIIRCISHSVEYDL